ncbi:HAD family hydrolase [Conexibacter woesei]|uniref:HAD family hydrolase n=1 Tax=Conexibacter woesei TaxID=191495 RepID=UPI00047D8212|nr:HAD family hydrolase [Conexibacter woesei]
MDVQAVTVDLDDTIWPYAPIAMHIAETLKAFLAEAGPRAAEAFDPTALSAALTAPRETRQASSDVQRWLTPDGLRAELAACGHDPDLAGPALQATDDARQHVVPFPEAESALGRIGERYRILALTEGASDVERIGVAGWFDGVITSRDVGVSKPDPRIFRAACTALDLPPSSVLHAGNDLAKDVHGALAAGMQAAWVRRDPEGTEPPGVLVVADLSELASALGV